MVNILVVILILFWHWVADFIFQTDWQAQNKSKSWNALLQHTGIYAALWAPIMAYLYHFDVKAIFFVTITFIAHTITDYFTSRLNSKLWAEKKVHWFFVSIGFDQFLHFTQLLLTYYLLKK